MVIEEDDLSLKWLMQVLAHELIRKGESHVFVEAEKGLELVLVKKCDVSP